MQQFKKSLAIIIPAAVIVIIVVVIIRASKPAGPDYSKTFPIMNQVHIPAGEPHDPYNSNPPTSGWLSGQTAKNDFYTAEIPDEYIIHNLEHGDIWIAYKPEISDEVKTKIKKYAGPRVIVTPRAHNETDLALVAWGRLDAFNLEGGSVPEQRILDFIKRYQNKGPEKIPFDQHDNLNFN